MNVQLSININMLHYVCIGTVKISIHFNTVKTNIGTTKEANLTDTIDQKLYFLLG